MNAPTRPDWMKLVASEDMDSFAQTRLIRFSIDTVKAIVGPLERVLCVGCGDGTELKMFGDGAFGIDVSDQAIAHCREQMLHVEKMDMHEMEFADDEFDLVYSKDNFEHAISPIRAISEFARVSKKYVVVVLPDESWQSSKWHFVIPTMHQMVTLGEKVGLMLRSYREYTMEVNQSPVKQHLYLFQKLCG